MAKKANNLTKFFVPGNFCESVSHTKVNDLRYFFLYYDRLYLFVYALSYNSKINSCEYWLVGRAVRVPETFPTNTIHITFVENKGNLEVKVRVISLKPPGIV